MEEEDLNPLIHMVEVEVAAVKPPRKTT